MPCTRQRNRLEVLFTMARLGIGLSRMWSRCYSMARVFSASRKWSCNLVFPAILLLLELQWRYAGKAFSKPSELSWEWRASSFPVFLEPQSHKIAVAFVCLLYHNICPRSVGGPSINGRFSSELISHYFCTNSLLSANSTSSGRSGHPPSSEATPNPM